MERQTSWIFGCLPMASFHVCAAPLMQHGTIVAVGWNGLCHIYSPRHRHQRWQALPPMGEWRHACGVVPLGDEIVVLGGFNGSPYSLSSVERLKLDDEGQPLGNWEAAPRMTEARSYCAAVVAEGKIVVVGGFDLKSDSHLSSAEMFDPLKNTWESLPDMAKKRSGCAAVAIGDKIYVFGGYDGSSFHNSAEYLCINTEKWHSLPPMRKPRHYPAAVAIGGRILVVGGRDERGKLCDVEVLDTSTRRWEEDHDIPSLNTGRYAHGATTVENRIYVVGGVNNNNGNRLDTMEILEVQEAPNTMEIRGENRRCWRRRLEIFFAAAVAIGGVVFVMGGKNEQGRKLCDVEVLDATTMRWEKDHGIPSLNTGRYKHGATTVEDRIFVVGGEDNNDGRLDTMEILEVLEAPHPSQSDLVAEIAKRDSEIAKLRTQIARECTKTCSQEPLMSTTSIQEPSPNTEASQPDYSEFETRIDLEAEVATLKKQIQDGNDSFKPNVITLAVQAKKRLALLEELLKTMPTAQKLRSDISDLEKGIRRLRDQNRLEEAIPLARKHEELTEQLRKKEMAEAQKTLPRPLSDKPR